MELSITKAVKAVYELNGYVCDESAAHDVSILTGRDVKASTVSRRLRELRRADGIPPRKRVKYRQPERELPESEPLIPEKVTARHWATYVPLGIAA